ncbi:hypothetical protein D0Z00_000264 [Geotrichum galactomycetum]|uniref:Uncharacterized protein n=1 Tax=Geotrichum galactomycetum TaxID=27317 RepID=A0ACB6VAD6_9ASCO|nr:hypothetical protein D0Z00_000264 [Geotrichum candidum]
MASPFVLPPEYTPAFNDLEELPPYTAGIEIHPMNSKKREFEVKIEIANKKDSYNVGDIICGVIKFCPPKPVKISGVHAIIEGGESTKQNGWLYDRLLSKHIKLAYYIVPSIPEDMIAVPGNVYTFPFTLQIPELLQFDYCKDSIVEHLRIPPSLGSRTGLDIPEINVQNKAAIITYHLGACIKVDVPKDSLVNNKYQAFNVIQIIPSYTLTPKDVKRVKDHPYNKKAPLKKLGVFKRSQSGSIDLKLDKVLAYPITLNKRVFVPLTVTLGDVNEAMVASFQTSRISMKILAHTSFTNQQQSSATFNDNNTKLSVLKEEPEILTQKFKLSNYIPTATTWLPNYANDTYAAHFNVPFVLPAVRQLVPSFESCLISRKYSLSVTIHFKHGDSWSIKVPINLVNNLDNYSIAPYNETSGLDPISAPAYTDDSSEVSNSITMQLQRKIQEQNIIGSNEDVMPDELFSQSAGL